MRWPDHRHVKQYSLWARLVKCGMGKNFNYGDKQTVKCPNNMRLLRSFHYKPVLKVFFGKLSDISKRNFKKMLVTPLTEVDTKLATHSCRLT